MNKFLWSSCVTCSSVIDVKPWLIVFRRCKGDQNGCLNITEILPALLAFLSRWTKYIYQLSTKQAEVKWDQPETIQRCAENFNGVSMRCFFAKIFDKKNMLLCKIRFLDLITEDVWADLPLP